MSPYPNYQTYQNNQTYNPNYPTDENEKESVFTKDNWKDITCWYLNLEQETVTQLEMALAKENFNQLIILGDQIYGHGGAFGFERVSVYGQKIEQAAIEKNTISLSCLISSLKCYLGYLLRTIQEESTLNY